MDVAELIDDLFEPGAVKAPHVELLYGILFGRRADEGGMAAHLNYASKHPQLRMIDLAELLMESDEFRSRHTKLAAYAFEDRLIELKINDTAVLIPSNDWVYAQNVRGEDDSYEAWVHAVIQRTLKAGSVFLDIGANVGVHTMAASDLVGATGAVYAVDASLENCRVIQSSARRYGRGNIVIVPMAASDSVRVENISIDSTGSNKVVRRDNDPALGSYNFEKILCGTLDGLLPDLTRLDLVKVDVEGREGSVLKGALKTLERFKPAIIAEYHPSAPETYFVDDLLALGYTISVLEKEKGGKTKFIGKDRAALDALFEAMRGSSGATHLDLLFEPPLAAQEAPGRIARILRWVRAASLTVKNGPRR